MTLEEYLTDLLTPPPNTGFGVTPDTLARGVVSRLRSDGYRVVKLEQGEGDPDCTWGHLIVTEELT